MTRITIRGLIAPTTLTLCLTMAACSSTAGAHGGATPSPATSGEVAQVGPAAGTGASPGSVPSGRPGVSSSTHPGGAGTTPGSTTSGDRMSPIGHSTVTAGSRNPLTFSGSLCQKGAGGQAVWFFGQTGARDEVEVSFRSGYNGPGTYVAGVGIDAAVAVSHYQDNWYSRLQDDPGSQIVINADGLSGSFKFVNQLDNRDNTASGKDLVTGTFSCTS